MGGQSTQFLKKIVEQFYCLKGIVLSDSEGILICQSVPQKDNQKFVQATSMLISAIKQAQSNLQKTKTYSQIRAVNYYYEDNLIHLAHAKNLMVTLFLNSDTNIELAREISVQVALSFQKLNAKIPQIKEHCH